MKYLLATLILVLGLLIPVSGFAWNEDTVADSDEDFYERSYTQCALRSAGSQMSEAEVECLCSLTAEHAVRWRHRVQEDRIPALPEQDQARCASGH